MSFLCYWKKCYPTDLSTHATMEKLNTYKISVVICPNLLCKQIMFGIYTFTINKTPLVTFKPIKIEHNN